MPNGGKQPGLQHHMEYCLCMFGQSWDSRYIRRMDSSQAHLCTLSPTSLLGGLKKSFAQSGTVRYHRLSLYSLVCFLVYYF